MYMKIKKKIKFVDDFLIKYLTDQEYRNSTQNTWVVFIDNKITEISYDDIPFSDIPGYKQKFVHVTDHPIREYLFPAFQVTSNTRDFFGGIT